MPRVTQGTRGQTGQRWCERIWTAIATCVQQGRSVFQYLEQTVLAHFLGRASPLILARPDCVSTTRLRHIQ
jgi:hypothetical protein